MTFPAQLLTTCSLAVLLAGASFAQDVAVDVTNTPPASPSDSDVRAPLRAALVIGNNRSPRGALPDLQFADDDALRTSEVLRAVMPGVELTVLTRPDDDTARLFGEDARAATPPTRAAVDAAVAALTARFAQARAAGADTELFVLFSGHGERDQNGGYLELEDGALRRGDLLSLLTLIKPARAHVVLDACNSFFVVNARRPGGRPFVVRNEIEAGLEVPGVDVGVLLSTSADAQVYEWSQLSGGIFSHVLRSALSGSADANTDGLLTYNEIQGFMDVAVKNLPNAEYRPRLFMKATADGRFFTLPQAPVLRGAVGHVTVRDARGVRVLDTHPEAGFEPRLVVAGAAPFTATQRGLDGRLASMSVVVDADTQALVMSAVAPERALAMRGPPLVFDNLFAAAFGPVALAASAEARRREPEPVYGLSMAQLQRIALQLRISGQKERQDRTANAASSLALGSAGILAGVGVGAAVLSNTLRGFEDPNFGALAGYGPILAIGGAIGVAIGGVQLSTPSTVELSVDALDASGSVPSEAAAIQAISALRVETVRKERALLSEREGLLLSHCIGVLTGASLVGLGVAPMLNDEAMIPVSVAAGAAYVGVSLGGLTMLAYQSATGSAQDDRVSSLAQMLQLIDEDPDGPSIPRAQLPSVLEPASTAP